MILVPMLELKNKTLAALIAGGNVAAKMDELGFEMIIQPDLGAITLYSSNRDKIWDEGELVCEAFQAIACVDSALHDLETHDD